MLYQNPERDFSPTQMAQVLGEPESSCRLYGARIGLPPRHLGSRRRWSTGDLIAIAGAKILVEQGYRPSLACALVAMMGPEFARLATEEDCGAEAWLVWQPQRTNPNAAEAAIVRSIGDLAAAAKRYPSASIVPVAPIMCAAMSRVLAKLQEVGDE